MIIIGCREICQLLNDSETRQWQFTFSLGRDSFNKKHSNINLVVCLRGVIRVCLRISIETIFYWLHSWPTLSVPRWLNHPNTRQNLWFVNTCWNKTHKKINVKANKEWLKMLLIADLWTEFSAKDVSYLDENNLNVELLWKCYRAAKYGSADWLQGNIVPTEKESSSVSFGSSCERFCL